MGFSLLKYPSFQVILDTEPKLLDFHLSFLSFSLEQLHLLLDCFHDQSLLVALVIFPFFIPLDVLPHFLILELQVSLQFSLVFHHPFHEHFLEQLNEGSTLSLSDIVLHLNDTIDHKEISCILLKSILTLSDRTPLGG